MVWKMDPLSNVNFHKYLDEHEHLLLIVELENGHRVGGYTEAKLQPKMQSNKDGLILSISNKSSFELVEPNRRAVTYDNYYIIFGNS